MAKAKVYTRDGNTHEIEVDEHDNWVDDLPFSSGEVTRTVVVDDGDR